jgi:hypothetical protein
MSTVRANQFLDAAGGNTATINGMTPTAQSLQGFRNRIINGNMVIDQRNAGAAVTTTGAGIYFVDRWTGFRNNAGWSVQQVADAPSGFVNSLRVTTTTANAGSVALVQQWFEGNNVADLGFGTASASTVTLSFWVKSSVTGTFAVNLANGATNRSYVATYTINAANTWEYKTVTVAGDTTGTWATNNTAGLRVLFNIGTGGSATTAGSWQTGDLIRTSTSVGTEGTLNATWQVTGVQLEAGSVATPFERRDYGRELMLCQRYYEKSYNTDVAVGASTSVGQFTSMVAYYAAGSLLYGASVPFKVTKRATPVVSGWSAGGVSGQWLYGVAGVSEALANVVFYELSAFGFKMYLQSVPSGQNNTYGHWAASAEL